MKITHCHRHITKSEYQPGIAVQAHDTSLLSSKDTTGNTDFLLFLKIVLQRPIHQFDIVRHGFVQIDKFLHLALRDDCRTVCVIVRHQILAGKHGRQNTVPTAPRERRQTASRCLRFPFSSVKAFNFWVEPVAKASFTTRAESRRAYIPLWYKRIARNVSYDR